jgi:hypothetical protein
MLREYPRSSLEKIAALAVLEMEGLIEAMEKAAEQVRLGAYPENVATEKYQLYITQEEGRYLNIACVLSAEDYFNMISSAAGKAGASLEEMVDLHYKAPDMEFDEGMVTGWFHAFKGASVEVSNAPMEELLGCIIRVLRSKGLMASCSPDEEVVFYLPIKSQGTEAHGKPYLSDP